MLVSGKSMVTITWPLDQTASWWLPLHLVPHGSSVSPFSVDQSMLSPSHLLAFFGSVPMTFGALVSAGTQHYP